MKHIFLKSAAVVFALTLMGCSAAPSPNAGNNASNADKDTKAIKAAGDDVSLNKPVVIPPGYNDRPLEPGQKEATTLPNGLPALSPSKGLKIDELFAEDISSTDKRIERIENAHLDFRKEYEQLKPAIVRLAAIEEDLQSLMSELNGFVDVQTSPNAIPIQQIEAVPPQPQEIAHPDAPITKTATLAPSDIKAEPEPTEPPKADAPKAPISIQDIRIGNHPDKTRIVIDLDARPEFNLDLNNDEKIFMISLSDTGAGEGTAQSKQFPKSPLLASYKITNQNNEAQLIIDLKKTTKIMSEEMLAPKNGKTLHRLVIDLKL